MSIKFKYGKGKGSHFEMSFGGLEAKLTETFSKKTLKQIANILAKQSKIKDGEIELINITFNYAKNQK